jgi:hypothetical protein
MKRKILTENKKKIEVTKCSEKMKRKILTENKKKIEVRKWKTLTKIKKKRKRGKQN